MFVTAVWPSNLFVIRALSSIYYIGQGFLKHSRDWIKFYVGGIPFLMNAYSTSFQYQHDKCKDTYQW